MSSPIFNDFSMFPNMKQLTNRKNKYTIKYTTTDEIEEAIYQKKQRRYLKNRSEFFNNQSDNKPNNGEIVKIYNIEYYVETFNPLNGKHALINTQNFSRRYFDLQLYTWEYVKPLFDNKFIISEPIIPTNLFLSPPLPPIPTNLFLSPPLPPIPTYESIKLSINEFNDPLTITIPNTPVLSPIKIDRHFDKTNFDIESQELVTEPFHFFDFSFNSLESDLNTPMIEKDLIIEDLDIIEEFDIVEESKHIENEEDLTIGACINYDYFTTENIKNWDVPVKSTTLIVVHDNSPPLESIIEESDEDEASKEANKATKGYCSIM